MGRAVPSGALCTHLGGAWENSRASCTRGTRRRGARSAPRARKQAPLRLMDRQARVRPTQLRNSLDSARETRADALAAIHPARCASPRDRVTYQTVYARHPGSVAAPTAGLHFTRGLLEQLAESNITWVDLLLHVGLGTFRPIDVEHLEEHKMHTEWAELSAQTAATINSQRSRGGRILAVGTTSARALETASAAGTLQAFSGETNLFIRPGHVFHGFDALITNFHLPRSSLLVLVSAFAGVDLIRAAYAEAVQARYRFFSYGDAMLIL